MCAIRLKRSPGSVWGVALDKGRTIVAPARGNRFTRCQSTRLC